jgi:uncharacterized protein (DUF1778 family)
MATAALPYLDRPSDARIEMRLPAALKAHAVAIALAKGEPLSQYLVEVLAERVAEELAGIRNWSLTVPEQQELLKILTQAPPQSVRLERARARAEVLFGPEL